MHRIPCKKCDHCGKFSDISAVRCKECDNSLIAVTAKLIDYDKLSANEIAEINVDVPVFVRKCNACGALNFTLTPDQPVDRCFNCHKRQSVMVAAVKFVSEEEESGETEDKEAASEITNKVKRNDSHPSTNHVAVQVSNIIHQIDEEEEDDDDDASLHWANVYKNVKNNSINSDNETSSQKVLEPSPITKITLEALTHGRTTKAFSSEGAPYKIGRSGEMAEYLQCDSRVGNEHCYLKFENGSWYIEDLHSQNGTFVNDKDIGLNGKKELHDGDKITLGHHSDSIAFRVSVR